MKALTLLSGLCILTASQLVAQPTYAAELEKSQSNNEYYSAIEESALHHNSGTLYDYATVLSAEPVFKTIHHSTPVKNCWVEPVTVHHKRKDSATPEIFGAIIGGAIGNAIGHNKSNKRVGTVAGAILGASIAHDAEGSSKRRHHHHVEYREHCEITEVTNHVERKLKGYHVTYRYKGQTLQTYTDSHPGKKLKIALNISVAE
ncbi:glycine zipper 2TM domain-containing protein [Flocculibacter collagenilyticus]|uniref:glycine zipper 2TM domain-containing protein n=1 Tax=Flocculibacter collagenilyticus TaxID=2744479 RepID=UPI0018F5E883|nr:glycine zipper 2TM domain-containing protein [Flocculibacter collagenilyticus]